jgi:hypothetical protein
MGATEFFLGLFKPFINVASFDSRQVSSYVHIIIFQVILGELCESSAGMPFEVRAFIAEFQSF